MTAVNILKNQIEFHRNAIALLPKKAGKSDHVAFYIGSTPPVRLCSCKTSKRKTCPHIIALERVVKTLLPSKGTPGIDERFRNSHWYCLSEILASGGSETRDTIRFERTKNVLVVFAATGHTLLELNRSAAGQRFMERCGKISRNSSPLHRGAILQQLSIYTLTNDERTMLKRGYRTRRQALEESFWFRVAYHFFQEFGMARISFRIERHENTGKISLIGQEKPDAPVFKIWVAADKAGPVIHWLDKYCSEQKELICHSAYLAPVYKVSLTDKQELEVIPHYVMKQANTPDAFFEKKDIDACRYGELAYLPSVGGFVRIEPFPRDKLASFSDKMVVRRDRVPAFLNQFQKTLATGPYLLDERLRSRQIFTSYKRAVINSKAVERDWCWLSVEYGFGSSTVSLTEILNAKRSGQRFIETNDGWVDLKAPDLADLDGFAHLTKVPDTPKKSTDLKLSRLEVFRLQATNRSGFEIEGTKDRAMLLKQMLALTPRGPMPEIEGLTSSLRGYQTRGVAWCWFLYTSRFGGLLCDDMGLGKTHQAMALMLAVSVAKAPETPFLIVCPTTVLSHWERKIEAHAPGLTTTLYHGNGRDLDSALKESRVILTSYGVLRKDIDKLAPLPFPLVIFDEIQHIKNPSTQAYQAAAILQAETKLGLTGTPIENSLSDLKALMDLTVPGYLGPDAFFRERYIIKHHQTPSNSRQTELRRLISPFTLRRLKETVLPELPEKIEDVRFCRLSSEQVKLYQDAVRAQGEGLLETLKTEQSKVPYIHVFALLGLLKQICDHPVLLNKNVENYKSHASGKWELFKELLAESLDSGQKVVVYSQFLGMIRIISAHLKACGVGHVTLTGATRNRGRVIDKFNTKPDCRVYVGSLKAGGTGVDLVAGSVVIHYDRWWNAAREDQATDRVHRIGQQRGVQVFKLVTQGTLEEKISALIDEKRNLLDTIIKEDDPGILKSFTREELIEILSIPIEDAENDLEFED